MTITTLFFKLSINVSYSILWVKNDQATIRIEKSESRCHGGSHAICSPCAGNR